MKAELRSVVSIAVLMLSFVGAAAVAHHSGAVFDHERVQELHGTIKEFQFTNPHSWIQLDVPGRNGEVTEWSLEWGSPNQLSRRGIRPRTFPPGVDVTVRMNPMKDGSPAGAFVGAKFEDGTVVGRWE